MDNTTVSGAVNLGSTPSKSTNIKEIMEFVWAQVLGFIALILICIGYFLKEKSKFLIIQIVSNFFYAAAFFVWKHMWVH